jgi:hypothetical protein
MNKKITPRAAIDSYPKFKENIEDTIITAHLNRTNTYRIISNICSFKNRKPTVADTWLMFTTSCSPEFVNKRSMRMRQWLRYVCENINKRIEILIDLQEMQEMRENRKRELENFNENKE